MELFKLFYALTEAMYQSILQGVVIYVVCHFILAVVPIKNPATRYNLLFSAHCLIFILFLASLYTIEHTASVSTVANPAHLTADNIITDNTTIKNAILSNAPFIGVLYCAGIFIQSILLVSGYLQLKRIKQEGEKLSESWHQKLEELKARLGISKKVELYTGKKAWVPFTAGYLVPIIYYPFSAFANLSPAMAEAILIHELAHIRRNDYLFNIIQKGIETLLFFNPFTWMLGAEIRKEREYCCDDLVVKYGCDKKLYASALYILEQSREEQLSLGMAATGHKSNHLLERIKRITDMNMDKPSLKPGLIALAGMLAISLSVAWASPLTDTIKAKKAVKKEVPAPPPAPQAPDAAALSLLPSAPEVPSTPLTPLTNAPEAPMAPLPPDSIIIDTAKLNAVFNNKDWKLQQEKLQKLTVDLQKKFQSEEWKEHQKLLAKSSEDLKKHFNSPEWKKHQELIARNAAEIKKHFESPEWKKHQQLMARNTASDVKKYFESAEWKKQQQLIEKNAQDIAKHFDSPEWKKQQQLIEENAAEITKHVESAEWKNQVKEIEKQAAAIGKQFDSPEWKKKFNEIEKQLEINFDSPDLKKKPSKPGKNAPGEKK